MLDLKKPIRDRHTNRRRIYCGKDDHSRLWFACEFSDKTWSCMSFANLKCADDCMVNEADRAAFPA